MKRKCVLKLCICLKLLIEKKRCHIVKINSINMVFLSFIYSCIRQLLLVWTFLKEQGIKFSVPSILYLEVVKVLKIERPWVVGEYCPWMEKHSHCGVKVVSKSQRHCFLFLCCTGIMEGKKVPLHLFYYAEPYVSFRTYKTLSH